MRVIFLGLGRVRSGNSGNRRVEEEEEEGGYISNPRDRRSDVTELDGIRADCG